jgi:hypothetical protein
MGVGKANEENKEKKKKKESGLTSMVVQWW